MDSSDEQTLSKKPEIYQQILISILALAAISFVNIVLETIIQPSSLVFIYLIATIMSASFFGTWPAVLTSLGGLLIYDFLFVEPKYKFSMYHTQDIYNVTVFFIVALIIIELIKIVQRQNLIVRFRLDRAGFVEDMSRDFLIITPIDKTPEHAEAFRDQALEVIGRIIIKHTKKIVDVPMFVSFQNKSGPLQVSAKSDEIIEVQKKDLDRAYGAIKEGEIVGSTSPGSKSSFSFVPLTSHDLGIGVLGIQYDYKKLSPEQQSLLKALTNQASMAAERWMTD